jgi:hypothetical protein
MAIIISWDDSDGYADRVMAMVNQSDHSITDHPRDVRLILYPTTGNP